MQNLLYAIIGLQAYTIVYLHFFSGGSSQCPDCVCKAGPGRRGGVDVADAPAPSASRSKDVETTTVQQSRSSSYNSRARENDNKPAGTAISSLRTPSTSTTTTTLPTARGLNMSVVQKGGNVKMWLNQFQPYGMGIVLGVGKSRFCLELLQEWRNSGGLYLVDPFIHIWRGYDEPDNVSDKEHQMIFESLRNQLAPYEQKHSLVRDFSSSFVVTYTGTPGMPPPSLVWVDTNPNYESILRDLRDWWPVVTQGGLLAGPNYERESVKLAVHTYAKEAGYKVGQFADGVWFLEKAQAGRAEL